MSHRIAAACVAGTLAFARRAAASVAPKPAAGANLRAVQGRVTVGIGVVTGALPMETVDSRAKPTGSARDAADLGGRHLRLLVPPVPPTPPARIPALRTGPIDGPAMAAFP